MRPTPVAIDAAQDRADQDAVVAVLDALSERRRWLVYQTLYAQGLRISEAPHAIAKLAPRRAAQ